MKRTLTKQVVKRELKNIYIHDAVKYGIGLLICVAYLVLYRFQPQLSIYQPAGIVWWLSPVYFFLIATCAVHLYKTFQAYRLIKHNKITITTDVMVDKRKKAHISRSRGHHYTYVFLFEKAKEYKRKEHIFNISNPYPMDNEQYYNTSQTGDAFYIVSVGQKTLLAYPLRLFALDKNDD